MLLADVLNAGPIAAESALRYASSVLGFARSLSGWPVPGVFGAQPRGRTKAVAAAVRRAGVFAHTRHRGRHASLLVSDSRRWHSSAARSSSERRRARQRRTFPGTPVGEQRRLLFPGGRSGAPARLPVVHPRPHPHAPGLRFAETATGGRRLGRGGRRRGCAQPAAGAGLGFRQCHAGHTRRSTHLCSNWCGWIVRGQPSSVSIHRASGVRRESRRMGRGAVAARRNEDQQTADLWIVRRDVRVDRLTSGDGHKSAPVWSPDGSRIAYLIRNARTGVNDLAVQPASAPQFLREASHRLGQPTAIPPVPLQFLR